MKALKEQLQNALTQNDKKAAVQLVQSYLSDEKVDLLTLYFEILTPLLNEIAANDKKQTIPIWEEHLKSNIMRTVLENCYPFVSNLSVSPIATVLVVCFQEEYHDIGARMIADILENQGFQVFFIGANTPEKEILDAISTLEPDLLAISITNFFHLTNLAHFLDSIKDRFEKIPKIAIGGQAVMHSENIDSYIQVDYVLTTVSEIQQLKEVFS